MHRAALTTADPVLLAVNLKHHALGIDTFGDAVTMAAMGRGDHVPIIQMHANTNTRSFLTRIKMNKPRYIARRKLLVKRILKLSDGGHPTISLS